MNIRASDLFCTGRFVAKGLEKLLLFRCFKDRDNTPRSKLQIPVWIGKTHFECPYPHMANNQLSENSLSVEKKKETHFFSSRNMKMCILNMPLKFVATSCYKYKDWGHIEIQSTIFLQSSVLGVDSVEIK